MEKSYFTIIGKIKRVDDKTFACDNNVVCKIKEQRIVEHMKKTYSTEDDCMLNGKITSGNVLEIEYVCWRKTRGVK